MFKHIVTSFLLSSFLYAKLLVTDIDPSNMQSDFAVIIFMVLTILLVLFKGKTLMRFISKSK